MVGMFDGLTGTWLRQMTYSICRFWAYDASKEFVGASAKDAPPWKLLVAGSMGASLPARPCMSRALSGLRYSWRHCGLCRQSGRYVVCWRCFRRWLADRAVQRSSWYAAHASLRERS
jgi:hypothetical protein